MDWLALVKLDRALRLDPVQGFMGDYPRLSGTYQDRPFRLRVIGPLVGDEAGASHKGNAYRSWRDYDNEAGPSYYGNAHRSLQDFDEGLRIHMALENPRAVGMSLQEHGGNFTAVRQWLQRLQHQDDDQQFAVRFQLDVWPAIYGCPIRVTFQRREFTHGLLHTRSPVRVALNHNRVTFSTPHRLSPARSVPLVRLAFALAEAIEPALLLAA
jgi:hypothetical protein